MFVEKKTKNSIQLRFNKKFILKNIRIQLFSILKY